jgi:hypothetical protein
MSGSGLLHRQLSPEDLQQLRAWYKIRDTLVGRKWPNRTSRKQSSVLLFVSTQMLSG